MRRIVKEVDVPAPVDEVWDAWTTADGVTSFAPPQADIELWVGGRYEWYFDLDAPPGLRGGEGCTVLAFLPGRMLAFSWNAPPALERLRAARARTQVVVELEPRKDRTFVRLTQHGFGVGGDWDDYVAYFERAWGIVVDNLVARFTR